MPCGCSAAPVLCLLLTQNDDDSDYDINVDADDDFTFDDDFCIIHQCTIFPVVLFFQMLMKASARQLTVAF